VLAEVPGGAELVICTPGAEPVAPDGYGAALLLDGWALLSRADLRAGEEALRRWMAAAALVRPGGTVVVGADAAIPVVQALVRWDPVGHAQRELVERGELGFPPAVRMAAVTGVPTAVRDLVSNAALPSSAEIIGPVQIGPESERTLIRVSREQGTELASALKIAASARSSRKAADAVKLVLDAHDLL
jgi:primosomal protein N' (replication factor Y) (superfamily II helicase)